MSTFSRSMEETPHPVSLTISRSPRVELVSHWTLAWRRLKKNQLAVMGLFVVLFHIGLALGADALAPYSFHKYNFAVYEQDPTREYFLGTDYLGRDVFTLLMYGARVSLSVAIVVPAMIVLIGVPVGLVAGFAGGRVDSLLMRVTDVMFAFPSLLFLVLIVSVFGRSLWTIFIALGIASWPSMARIVRGQTFQIKHAEYVLGARAIGVKRLGILWQHVLPNIVGPVAVTATLSIPQAIMNEAMLTFLGLGIEPATPSWGMMINQAREAIFWHPLLLIFPSVAISSLTLAMTFIGDGLRDALDPRLSRS